VKVRRPPTRDRILAAIESIAETGREPSVRTVRQRIIRDSVDGRGVSLSDIAPVLRAWSDERLERSSGAIETAVEAILSLRTSAERSEVSRLVQERTAGRIRAYFTVSRRTAPARTDRPTADIRPPKILSPAREAKR